jgi:superfamily II DNA or RNA helicase
MLTRIEDVICYDSLGKYTGRKLNILADEAAHVTDLVLSQLEEIDSSERIFLSATITSEVIDRIKFQYPDLSIYSISLMEGIELGIAPKQDIRLIKVSLRKDDVIWEKIRMVNKEKKVSLVSSADMYENIDSNILYWKNRYMNDRQDWIYFKWMQAGLARKNWLAEYKLPVAKEIISRLENEGKRFIAFVNSIDHSKKLGHKTAIHSKQKPAVNEELIRKFNNFEIDSLFSKEILSEGINLESVECCVYIQVDGSEGKVNQKIGRVNARTDFPIIYVLMVPGTRDEVFLKKTSLIIWNM